MPEIEVSLATLDGRNGFSLAGTNLSEEVATSVSILEDINGDGIDDVAFGTPSSLISGRTPSVYVVFGQREDYPFALFPSDLDGRNGFRITRPVNSINLGFSVSSAGDVNGDGVNDLIFGAPASNPQGRFEISGESFVVFGRADDDPFPEVLDVDTLEGTTGFTIDGAIGDRAGASVSGAGDVNGDGVDDFLIGAPDNDRAYLVYGQSGVQPETIDLTQLDRSEGVVFSGVTDDFAGSTVRNLGDFNGDGFDDIAIAAPTASVSTTSRGTIQFAGRVYGVYGGSDLPSEIDLTTLNGNNGFIFQGGETGGGLIGSAIDGAGDFNNDGLDDLIIGERSGNRGAGKAYIIYGQSDSFSAPLTPDNLNSNIGLTINGTPDPSGLVSRGDKVGAAVSGIGDFNQDGVDDVMILAPEGDVDDRSNVGQSYVVYGQPGNREASLELENLTESDGFVLNGINPSDGDGGLGQVQQDGVSGRIDGGGDINDDGVPDIVIGSPAADPVGLIARSSGQGYVYFSGFDANSTNPDDPVDDPTPEPTPIFTPEPTPTPTPTPTPEPTPIVTPNPTPEPIPIVTPTPTPNPIPEPTPIVTPTPTPNPTPEPTPIFTPTPTPNPIPEPDPLPDVIPEVPEPEPEPEPDPIPQPEFEPDPPIINGPTITATNQNNIQIGTNNSEIIQGSPENNIQFAFSANDNLFGNEGNDTQFGNQGNDFIEGGNGDDVLLGGKGDDTLKGQANSDLFFGDLGNDQLYGGDSNDVLFGNIGNDLIKGGDGNDAAYGGRGNDTLEGEGGNDAIWGDIGNDVLIGVDPNSINAGRNEIDALTGGAGNDTFVLGDELQVYYDDGNGASIGLGDFARIEDFNINQDIIQLKGEPQDYRLEFQTDSNAIFRTVNGEDELIAILPPTSVLSLEADYFRFI